MNKCIFCLTTDPLVFNTKEHILPESLGGGDWAILPDGLYCDSCQNKFGSTIEQQALGDYPFVNLRTILGIPTKKRKAPWFNYWEGNLHSAGEPGKIIFEPNKHFEEAFNSGRKTLTIIPAFSKKPEMTLRTLLKIGLETIAANDSETIFEERFNSARVYALTGEKNYPWSYLQKEDDVLMMSYLKGETGEDHHCFMDVHYEESGLVSLHLRVFYLEFIVPLIENVQFEKDTNLREPMYRYITVE